LRLRRKEYKTSVGKIYSFQYSTNFTYRNHSV